MADILELILRVPGYNVDGLAGALPEHLDETLAIERSWLLVEPIDDDLLMLNANVVLARVVDSDTRHADELQALTADVREYLEALDVWDAMDVRADSANEIVEARYRLDAALAKLRERVRS